MATFREKLNYRGRRSSLCIGLDPEPSRFPGDWQGDSRRIYDFCAGVAAATRDWALAFKPQIAYFAANRAEDQLENLMAYLRSEMPDIPVILDAKRGDIGSTAEQYAREAFERYRADALTLSPFLGPDTVEPYLRYDGKGVILLCETSNSGKSAVQGRITPLSVAEMKSADQVFGGSGMAPERLPLHDWMAYDMSHNWGIPPERLGLVVGATHPGAPKRIRQLAGPEPMLLIPGIGAQGGSEVDAMAAWVGPGTVAVNASRSVSYAKNRPGETWEHTVYSAAKETHAALETARAQIATA